MIVFPICKINLGLHITAKRPDGYHDIETIFYPLRLCDALEFVISDKSYKKDDLTLTGLDDGSDPDENIVIKTVKKLLECFNIPFLKIHLHKAIPIGAGLGGGSSDAACFTRAINRYFKLNNSMQQLKEIVLEIGSDCPFFIDGTPAYAAGRGEILTPLNPVLKGDYLVLLNPGVAISTGEAYKNCRPASVATSLFQIINRPISEWKDLIVNDFEGFAFRKYPVIGEIKRELYNHGALFSLMSGSGSSLFGIFSDKPELPEKLREFVIWEGIM
jgi:4-diphosphocytidyl-2-C-methyl-D-erythritol kinase